jgi:hypothetical protein
MHIPEKQVKIHWIQKNPDRHLKTRYMIYKRRKILGELPNKYDKSKRKELQLLLIFLDILESFLYSSINFSSMLIPIMMIES